jgi:hypothetical protein
VVVAENLLGIYYLVMLPIWLTSKVVGGLFRLGLITLLCAIGLGCVVNYLSASNPDALKMIRSQILPVLDRAYDLLSSLLLEIWHRVR